MKIPFFLHKVTFCSCPLKGKMMLHFHLYCRMTQVPNRKSGFHSEKNWSGEGYYNDQTRRMNNTYRWRSWFRVWCIQTGLNQVLSFRFGNNRLQLDSGESINETSLWNNEEKDLSASKCAELVRLKFFFPISLSRQEVQLADNMSSPVNNRLCLPSSWCQLYAWKR